MDHPYYTVTVTNLTRGWSYTVTEGDEWDPADDVVLISPLTYAWGFENEVVPGPLEPCQAAFNLVARDVGDVPEIDLLDLVTLDVRVGTTGPRIIAPPPMKVAAADVTIDEVRTGPYAATLNVQLVDILGDLPGKFPQPHQFPSSLPLTQPRWRPRFAEIAESIGLTIGAPTWWSDDERPTVLIGAGSTVTGLAARTSWDRDAGELLRQLLNSHLPGGHQHTVTPGYSATPSSFPSGWRRVGPSTFWGWNVSNSDAASRVITEPQTNFRYYLVPASRHADAADGTALPMVFGLVDGRITLVPTFATGRANSRSAIDAGWCDLPAKARRSRDHVIAVVSVLGRETYWEVRAAGGSTVRDGVRRTFGDPTLGMSRDVDTDLDFGETTDSAGGATLVGVEQDAVATGFFTNDASRGVGWAYDAFQVVSSRIPQAVAEDLLPMIAPRFPGETNGDGLVLRHLVIYRPNARARFLESSSLVAGYIAAGSMKISGGDITWTLNLTPGETEWAGATSPVTIGDVTGGSYGTTTIANLDPLITVSDLDYVDS